MVRLTVTMLDTGEKVEAGGYDYVDAFDTVNSIIYPRSIATYTTLRYQDGVEYLDAIGHDGVKVGDATVVENDVEDEGDGWPPVSG